MKFDFITYMRTIATKLKEVAHVEDSDTGKAFHRVSGISQLEEFLQSQTFSKYPCIIVEDMQQGRLIDNGARQILDNQTFIFYIIKKPDLLDFDSKEQAKKDCEAILLKILSKLKNDMESDLQSTSAKTGMEDLDINSIFYQSVGPLGDNCFGIMCQFAMLNSINSDIIYNSNDWIS